MKTNRNKLYPSAPPPRPRVATLIDSNETSTRNSDVETNSYVFVFLVNVLHFHLVSFGFIWLLKDDDPGGVFLQCAFVRRQRGAGGTLQAATLALDRNVHGHRGRGLRHGHPPPVLLFVLDRGHLLHRWERAEQREERRCRSIIIIRIISAVPHAYQLQSHKVASRSV